MRRGRNNKKLKMPETCETPKVDVNGIQSKLKRWRGAHLGEHDMVASGAREQDRMCSPRERGGVGEWEIDAQ